MSSKKHNCEIQAVNVMKTLDTGSEKKNNELTSSNNNNIIRPNSASKGKYQFQREGSGSSLEILPPEGETGAVAVWDTRPSSAGRRPPSAGRPDSGSRRSATPSKNVDLTVSRKVHRDEEFLEAAPDWKESLEEENRRIEKEKHKMGLESLRNTTKNISEDNLEPKQAWTDNSDKHDKTSPKSEHSEAPKSPAHKQYYEEISGATKVKAEPPGDLKVTSADDQDSESEDSDSETKAPNELLMEFVNTVIEEDYVNAQKLCKMILLYEPDNPEAIQYSPLIEAKLKQEQEEETEESEEGEDSEDEDSEDEDEESDDQDESEADKEEEAESTEEEDEDGKWMELAQQLLQTLKQ